MKIGVYGSAAGEMGASIQEKARAIGMEIARRGHVVVTGACPGFPQDAVLGAQERHGKVIGFSPGVDVQDHVKRFKFPTEGITEFVFVPKSFKHVNNELACKKYRNVSSVAEADAAILIGGRIGTMNEFTIAYDLGKLIGILEGSGGITTRIIPMLLEDAKKASASRIVFEKDPAKLVQKLVEWHDAQK